MITATVLLLAAIGCATAQKAPTQTVQEFTKLIDASRAECVRYPAKRQKQVRYDQSQCGAPCCTTIQQIYAMIPGNRETVRRYATADFMKTLDLCVTRENNNATDWRKIQANRLKLGNKLNSDTWNDCAAQIKLEQADCKDAKNVLCAFRQGTAFNCAEPAQFTRQAQTLSLKGDQCNVIVAFGDGRPTTSAEFNKRVQDSRRGCLTKKDPTDAQCFGENSIELLLNRFPTGVNVKGNTNAYAGLSNSIDMCVNRNDAGFIKIRIKANQVYAAGKARNDCLAQLTQDEETCKKVKSILCAYSYGVDFSCADADAQITKRRVAIPDQCSEAVRAIETSV